jgi:hypothetical protein
LQVQTLKPETTHYKTENLPLALLVFRVDANDPNHAAAVDDLAFVTNLFYRCPYFHFGCSLFASRKTGGINPPLQKPGKHRLEGRPLQNPRNSPQGFRPELQTRRRYL